MVVKVSDNTYAGRLGEREGVEREGVDREERGKEGGRVEEEEGLVGGLTD